MALRIRAGREPDFVQHVAVDHRDGAGVLHPLHGVDEQRSRNALEREVHVAYGQAPDAELAAEVVASCDTRQHVNGAHRIVGDDAAQLLKLVAAEQLLRWRCALRRVAAHVDRFRIRSCAGRDGDGDVERLAGAYVDEAAHEDKIHRRHVQLAAAGRNAIEPKASVSGGESGERPCRARAPRPSRAECRRVHPRWSR